MNRIQLAGVLWSLQIVFFVANIVAQLAWTEPYSVFGYAISDLGAVTCFTEPSTGRAICSPAHLVMNVGFILAGVLMAAGAIALPLSIVRRRIDLISRVLLVIGGLGCAGVGLAPEDVALGAHTVAAVAAMVVGNIGLVLFGIGLRTNRRTLDTVALGLGTLGLIGVTWLITLLLTGSPARFSVGGLAERIAAFSLVFAQLVIGITLLIRPTSGTRAAADADANPRWTKESSGYPQET